jgi:putative transposase
MPRAPRVVEPNGYYHVVSRGNDKQAIFDDYLRALFLVHLLRIARRYDWRVLAYALMTNHFHLVMRIGEAGLSKGMCELNSGFARMSNARFGRIDHCFGKRFWSTHLETDRHFLASVRYAAWNPPRAGRCSEPYASRWTSFRACAGLDPVPPVLAMRELFAHFDTDFAAARRGFCDFVAAGRVRCQAPWAVGEGLVR